MNKIQKSQIKEIMQRPGWEALIVFTGQMIDKWRADEVKSSTEFDTLWRLATQKGKVDGINEFFNVLDREVLE